MGTCRKCGKVKGCSSACNAVGEFVSSYGEAGMRVGVRGKM